MKRLGDIMLPDLPHRNPCNKVTPAVRALRGAAGGAAGTRGSGAWGEVGGDQAGDDSSLPQGGPGVGDCGRETVGGGVREKRQTPSAHRGTC